MAIRRRVGGGSKGGTREKDLDAAYRRIVESAVDHAIFSTDPEGHIVTWSPGAEVVFGWTAAEAIGQPMDMTYTEEDRARGEPARERILARNDGMALNVRWHLCKDGSRVFIDGSTRAIYDDGRRLTGFAKIGRNVTERQRTDIELRESEAGLRSLNETLEARVAERTSALADTNQALVAEIREREGAEDARTAVIRTLVTAEENERGRISRELHDQMGQHATGLLLALRALEREERDPERCARIAELAVLAANLARDLHAVALVLRPPALDNLGLLQALQSHLEDWSQRHGIATDFHAEQIDPAEITDEVETTIYRIVQEGLTNVAKHARASRVSLVVEKRDGVISAILEDDGGGFDPDAIESDAEIRHLGLRSMRERLALLGGDLEIDSGTHGGTTLFARIPLTAVRPRAG